MGGGASLLKKKTAAVKAESKAEGGAPENPDSRKKEDEGKEQEANGEQEEPEASTAVQYKQAFRIYPPVRGRSIAAPRLIAVLHLVPRELPPLKTGNHTTQKTSILSATVNRSGV